MIAAFEEILLTICLCLLTFVDGCGVLPSRQSRTISFEVSGFKLPAAMVHTVDRSGPSKVPNISTSEQQAVTFVQNTVMQSIEGVLHQQGRGAGLSDDLISLILNQLDVTVKYQPLKCDIVFTNADGDGVVMEKMMNCQIMSGTVTKTCDMPAMNNRKFMCMPDMLKNIDPMHLIISGTITTTNVIMANWSTQMWQIVLNRALQRFASGPLSAQFILFCGKELE